MGILDPDTTHKATDYTTKTDQVPKWLQDLNYEQMMAAREVMTQPYQVYAMPRVADLSPDQLAAQGVVRSNIGNWQDELAASKSGLQAAAKSTAATDAAGGAGQFLRPGEIDVMFGMGKDYLGQAKNYYGQAAGGNSLSAALPYAQIAADTSGDYLKTVWDNNPYAFETARQIADLGARNLNEKLLPQISDSFIKAGQFGGNRMGEFGARALRDTQEAVLREQNKTLMEGWDKSLDYAGKSLDRNLQLAQIMGGLSAGDLSRQVDAARAAQQAAQALLQTGAQQQGYGVQAASAQAQAAAADAQRQESALRAIADIGKMQQSMGAADAASLDAIGQTNQQNLQRQLDVAYQSYQEAQNYPKQQLDWFQAQMKGAGQYVPYLGSTESKTTTVPGPSPLMQAAQLASSIGALSSGR